MTPDKKDYTIIASILLLATVTAVSLSQENNQNNPAVENWENIQLEDINSENTFTISKLQKPVVLETFAVWCPTCTRQQQEMRKLHKKTNITSVSLNVDPNEDRQQVIKHIEENKFNWKYTISPPQLTRSLVEEYGASIANPPSAPMVLVCENTSKKLQNGVKPASKIRNDVNRICG